MHEIKLMQQSLQVEDLRASMKAALTPEEIKIAKERIKAMYPLYRIPVMNLFPNLLVFL